MVLSQARILLPFLEFDHKFLVVLARDGGTSPSRRMVRLVGNGETALVVCAMAADRRRALKVDIEAHAVLNGGPLEHVGTQNLVVHAVVAPVGRLARLPLVHDHRRVHAEGAAARAHLILAHRLDHAVTEIAQVLLGRHGGNALAVVAAAALGLAGAEPAVAPVVVDEVHVVLAVAVRRVAGSSLGDGDVAQGVVLFAAGERALHRQVFKQILISKAASVLAIDRAGARLGAFLAQQVALQLVLELRVAVNRAARVGGRRRGHLGVQLVEVPGHVLEAHGRRRLEARRNLTAAIALLAIVDLDSLVAAAATDRRRVGLAVRVLLASPSRSHAVVGPVNLLLQVVLVVLAHLLGHAQHHLAPRGDHRLVLLRPPSNGKTVLPLSILNECRDLHVAATSGRTGSVVRRHVRSRAQVRDCVLIIGSTASEVGLAVAALPLVEEGKVELVLVPRRLLLVLFGANEHRPIRVVPAVGVGELGALGGHPPTVCLLRGVHDVCLLTEEDVAPIGQVFDNLGPGPAVFNPEGANLLGTHPVVGHILHKHHLPSVLKGSVGRVARVEGVREHFEAGVRHLQALHLVVDVVAQFVGGHVVLLAAQLTPQVVAQWLVAENLRVVLALLFLLLAED